MAEWRRIRDIIGVATATTLFITILLTVFLPASFSNSYIVCIETNHFGEHWFEFGWIMMGFIFFLDFVWKSLKRNAA